MKFLKKYKVYEDIRQAKAFLKKRDIPEDDRMFMRISSFMGPNGVNDYLKFIYSEEDHNNRHGGEHLHTKEEAINELKDLVNIVDSWELSKTERKETMYSMSRDFKNSVPEVMDHIHNINFERS